MKYEPDVLDSGAVKAAGGSVAEDGSGVALGGWAVSTHKGPITGASPLLAAARRLLRRSLPPASVSNNARPLRPSHPQPTLSWTGSRGSWAAWRRPSSFTAQTRCAWSTPPAASPSGAVRRGGLPCCSLAWLCCSAVRAAEAAGHHTEAAADTSACAWRRSHLPAPHQAPSCPSRLPPLAASTPWTRSRAGWRTRLVGAGTGSWHDHSVRWSSRLLTFPFSPLPLPPTHPLQPRSKWASRRSGCGRGSRTCRRTRRPL